MLLSINSYKPECTFKDRLYWHTDFFAQQLDVRKAIFCRLSCYLLVIVRVDFTEIQLQLRVLNFLRLHFHFAPLLGLTLEIHQCTSKSIHMTYGRWIMLGEKCGITGLHELASAVATAVITQCMTDITE